MRFIDLRLLRKCEESSCISILNCGCGPNFVFNRREEFESMICIQGFTFWFRFWLTFCFNPACKRMKAIYRKYPEAWEILMIAIHKKFLLGTLEETLKYCMDEAILSLKASDQFENDLKSNKKKESGVINECTNMAFGAALCKIFVKWLSTTEISVKPKDYWTIPEVYLHSDFLPGLLEKYLVNKWEDHLLKLLGVSHLRQVPWVVKVLYSENSINFDELNITIKGNPLLKSLQNDLDKEKSKIMDADEPINLTTYSPEQPKELCGDSNITMLLLKCVINKRKNEEDEHKNRKIITTSKDDNKTKCYQCLSAMKINNSRTCLLCKKEDAVLARRYCSDTCQVEHWFRCHQQEVNEVHVQDDSCK